MHIKLTMTPEQKSRRRFINAAALSMGTMGLQACGGGGGGEAQAAAAADDMSDAARVVRTVPPPALTALVTALSVTSSATGSRSFAASVFPLEGQVPAGSTLVSPDDGSLSCSVLTRWNDGSAALLVAAGTSSVAAGQTALVRLQLASTATSRPPLTTDSVARALRSVKLDLGALGTVEQTNFLSPERIWWTNSQVICARYRLRAPQHATLEGLVDVHAYADGRAFVEVVVENGRVDTTLPRPIKPADAGYVGTVSVNGLLIGTSKSTDSPEGTHSAFRCWYASTWVGGDPGVFVSQVVTDLQKHPLFFKMAQPAGDLSGYAADVYAPWTGGRHRGQSMGGAGDHPSIGPLTLWDAQFLQSGSAVVAKAVEANALCVLNFNVGYREITTGLVPDGQQLIWHSQQGNWPKTTNGGDVLMWEVAHHPAVGLMAFACRPSPVHMETAQRIASWNATWGAGGPGSANMTAWSGTGLEDGTGVFGHYYQPRGRAWCMRSLVHATFLSPDGSAWRAGGKRWLNLNRIYWAEWMGKPAALALGIPWANGPDQIVGLPQNNWPWPSWQTHFLIPELHKAAAVKLLSGSQQTELETLADWVASFPIRWVNEQPNGGWRYIPYLQLLPTDAQGNIPNNWATAMAKIVSAPPPSVAGTWFMRDDVSAEYANFFGEGVAGGGANGYYYISVWWAAFVAAVERGIPGSAQAWATLQRDLTNLETWRKGFSTNPRFGATPRKIGGVAV